MGDFAALFADDANFVNVVRVRWKNRTEGSLALLIVEAKEGKIFRPTIRAESQGCCGVSHECRF
ncbi:hypothetical protein [Mesorhizobium sp. B1-1-8]|uniref:hypothetical protein n=1 Tax=Mesorhizobium sp. B1-1-8 TaxID=2589976 RepID=UPI001D014240|nr:hypothetical protein [Mesorhizobium sp. B1-1-8]UCI09549.1 hypothetical protein FJ974_11065 [Mesorhizobium sp. B1-1-8]